MLLRYNEGQSEVASLDEARQLLGNQPKPFSIITQSPTTGMRKARYLEISPDGVFVDSYTQKRVNDSDFL